MNKHRFLNFWTRFSTLYYS